MEESLNQQLANLLGRLQVLEQEKAQMQSYMMQSSTASQLPMHEPSVSLPERFDGTRSKLRSFVNQVRLLFELQPRKYPTERIKVGLVGTLLTGAAAAWFCPLFENDSPLLENFELFIKELNQTFGDYDRAIVSANKLRLLRQGDNTASTYTTEFRLLASDLDWGENALIDQYRRGLNDAVKDLLITLPLPATLSEAISSAVKCDNRIRERLHERDTYNYTSRKQERITQNPEPTPMEIDGSGRGTTTRMQNRAVDERNRRINMNLCFYCGAPGHRIRNCLKKRSESLNSHARPN